MKINMTEKRFWGILISTIFTIFGLMCQYGIFQICFEKEDGVGIISVLLFFLLSIGGWMIEFLIYSACGFIKFLPEHKDKGGTR